jgi:2-haloacid dehalogenase
MADRWATFDCYGTLIDWEGGIRQTLTRLWPIADADRLLRHYHDVEPLIQEGRSPPSYREVLGRALRALSAIEGLHLPEVEANALADSLPFWRPFPEVPEALRTLRVHGWRLAVLSNTDSDLLAASLKNIGVPVDLTITAADAGSYKPAHGHWIKFFERSGADHSGHVHVGASLFHDIEPAEEMGMPAVWINRLAEQSTLSRSGELPDLTHLPETLETLIPAR